jgi:hypothetical protein
VRVATTVTAALLATTFAIALPATRSAAANLPIKYNEWILVPGNDGSQHVRVDVSLSKTGILDGTMDYENDSLFGFGAQVHVAVLDKDGNILAIYSDPGHSVDGKWPGKAKHYVFPLHFDGIPSDVLSNATSLKAKLTTGNGKNLIDMLKEHVDKLSGLTTAPIKQLSPQDKAVLAAFFLK